MHLRVRKLNYPCFTSEETGAEKLKAQDRDKITFRINSRINKYMAPSPKLSML